MKRGAEKQLSKDDFEDDNDEGEQENSGQGFKKATERVMAGRNIRALPKRAGTSSTSSFGSQGSMSSQSTTPGSGGGAEAGSTPKFAGFGGTNASSSFLFTPPSSTVPGVAASASQKTKDFASLMSSSSGFGTSTSTFPSTTTSQPTSKPAASSQPQDGQDDEAEFQYYLTLRGINTSILSAMSKAVEADPFADFSGMLDKYTSLRKQAQKDLDAKKGNKSSSTGFGVAPEKPTFAPPKPAPSSFTFPSSSSSTNTAPASTPSFSMPKPPSTFAGASSSTSTGVAPFSTTPTSSIQAFAPPKPSTATPSDTSEKPKSPAAPKANPFAGFKGFGSPANAAPATTPAFGGFGSSGGSSIPSSAFSAPPKTAEEGKEKAPAASTGFLFGSGKPAAAPGATGSSPFGSSSSGGSSLFGKPSDSTSAPNLFGAKPASTPSSGFSFAAPPAANGTTTTTTTSKSFSFGASPTPGTSPFGSSSGDGASKDGSTTPKKTDIFAGFGATKTSPGGSLGNPVGFGFGSGFGGSSAPSGGSSSAFGSGSGASLFSGSGSGSGSQESVKKDENSQSGGETGGGDEAEGVALKGTTQHDGEGEGEEDEEVLFEGKAKCHVLNSVEKDGKKTQGWSELGIGLARVKKHKTDGTRRILMRNSSSGRIILNFRLYQGFKPTLQTQPKGTLRFIGHSEGEKQTYMLKVGGDGTAEALLALIEKEVAALSSSD